MGRKAKFGEPGQSVRRTSRKHKRQNDPTFPTHILPKDNSGKNLSHRQKQRAAKRLKKKEELKQKRKEIKEQTMAMKFLSDNEPKEKNDKLSESSAKIKSELLESYTGNKSKWIKQKSKTEKKKLQISDISDEKKSKNTNCMVGTLDDLSDDDEKDSFKDENESDGDENESDEDENESDENNMVEDAESYDEEDVSEEKNDEDSTDEDSKTDDDNDGDEDNVKMNIATKDIFAFPSDEDIEKAIPIPEIEQRIKDVLFVLSDFKKFREQSKSRREYRNLLLKDLCTYFSYNTFLMERLLNIFPLDEIMNFLEASEMQRPVTIRTNTLKIRRRDLAQALIARGVNVDPIGKWTSTGLVVYDSPVPIGATPEYLAGFYMLQAASSLLPVIALAPKENERILDMCAAPGGKASHIAALMKNTGVLYANDANKTRVNGIVGNFHRLGITNSVICSYDGRKFPQVIKGFHRVLVDAPCTGTGVISKDPSVKTNKNATDVQRCFTLQRELILAAIDCLNARYPDGCLVYSTCSILPEENEAVINYALKMRDVKLVPTGFDFGTEGFTKYQTYRFHPTMNLTRRFYPHTHNMDGFFVAKLKKFSDVIPKSAAAASVDNSFMNIINQNGDSGFETEEALDERNIKNFKRSKQARNENNKNKRKKVVNRNAA